MHRFIIHFTLSDGSEDTLFLEGDDLEKLCEQAQVEIDKRNGTEPWSEELKD